MSDYDKTEASVQKDGDKMTVQNNEGGLYPHNKGVGMADADVPSRSKGEGTHSPKDIC